MDSFAAITHAKDKSIYETIACPEGAYKKAILSDYMPAEGIASYMSEEDVKYFTETFRKGGLGGPLCYYKGEIRGFNKEDDAGGWIFLSFYHRPPLIQDPAIPPERRLPPVSTPIFFGVGTRDLICTPRIGRMSFASEPFKNHNITIKEFDGDHWFTKSHGKEIARELDAWVSGVVVPAANA